jgi:hypothetical protein
LPDGFFGVTCKWEDSGTCYPDNVAPVTSLPTASEWLLSPAFFSADIGAGVEMAAAPCFFYYSILFCTLFL